MSMYFYCIFVYLHRAGWHSSATLTEVFPMLFPQGKCQGKTRQDGARPALFQHFCVVLCIVCFVSFCVLFVCKCVLYYCHWVATQLQLTNISYHFCYTPQSVHPSISRIIILTCSVILRQSVQWCLSRMVNIPHASVSLQSAF